MKSKSLYILKYMFIIISIILISIGIYFVYKKKNVTIVKKESNDGENFNLSVVENLKLGVQSYDTMNPLLTKNKQIIQFNKLIFEPLVTVTFDYHLENVLAKEIIKKDELTYLVKIDNNVKWQDGNRLIAKDVEYTIHKIQSLENSIYFGLVNDIEEVKCLNSEELQIKLKYEVPFFEYNLTFPIISSLYYINEDFHDTKKIPIGTGMYKIASINDENIFLIINDRWRKINTNMPRTQSITINKYNAIGEIFNSFKLGNTDIVYTDMMDFQKYVGVMGYNKKEIKGRNYEFLSMNCEDRILKDVSVRKAIAHCINKENLVSGTLGGTKLVSEDPLDYGHYLYNVSNKNFYNLEKAKKALQEGGWNYDDNIWKKTINGEKKELRLNIFVNENEERLNVANVIKNNLKEIGIYLKIIKISNEKYAEVLNKRNYQILMTGITNSINPNLEYFYGKNNIANYNNEEVQINLNNIEKISEIQNKIIEDVPYVGLYRNKGILILNSNVGGEFNINIYNIFFNFDKWYRQQ